jgi:hypothetical protein
MVLKTVQESAIIIDSVCDYIPTVSTVSNLVSLVIKVALEIFEAIDPAFHRAILRQPVFKHFDDKSTLVCLLLCIPGVNIVVALIRDLASDPRPSQSQQLRDLARQLDDTQREVERLQNLMDQAGLPSRRLSTAQEVI